MLKPKWEDAPEWAMYLVLNVNKKWYWFENAPYYNGDMRNGYTCNGRIELADVQLPYSEQRPEQSLQWLAKRAIMAQTAKFRQSFNLLIGIQNKLKIVVKTVYA